MQLRESGSSTCSAKHGTGIAAIIVGMARSARGAGAVSVKAAPVMKTLNVVNGREMGLLRVEQTLSSWSWALIRLSSLRGRGIDHEEEALLGGGKLGDVMFGMGSSDMLLHGAIPLFLHMEFRLLDGTVPDGWPF